MFHQDYADIIRTGSAISRISLLLCFAVGACGDPKEPSEGNFSKAIETYLQTNGRACTSGPKLPREVMQSSIDFYEKQRKANPNAQPDAMVALVAAGLVSGTATEVDSNEGRMSIGPREKKMVPGKRYDWTDAGKAALSVDGARFLQVPGRFGSAWSNQSGLCYAKVELHKIIKWDEPMSLGSYTETNITYQYALSDVAPWAKRPDIQAAMPDIKKVIEEAETAEQTITVKLTNIGWEVIGRR
jgi:hypothetical protein